MLDPMDCLRDGVPPSLLIDLLDDAGPDASGIYHDEPADDLTWTHPAEHAAHPAAQSAPRAAAADVPTQKTGAESADGALSAAPAPA